MQRKTKPPRLTELEIAISGEPMVTFEQERLILRAKLLKRRLLRKIIRGLRSMVSRKHQETQN